MVTRTTGDVGWQVVAGLDSVGHDDGGHGGQLGVSAKSVVVPIGVVVPGLEERKVIVWTGVEVPEFEEKTTSVPTATSVPGAEEKKVTVLIGSPAEVGD